MDPLKWPLDRPILCLAGMDFLNDSSDLMARESDKSVSNWLSQMADALRAGHSPSEAAELARGINRRTTAAICSRFETGDSWEDILYDECRFLDGSEFAVLIAAAKSGGLPESMEILAKAREFRMRSRRLMILASLYPLALIHLAILIVPASHLMDSEYRLYALSTMMILVPLWLVLTLFIIALRCFPAAINSMFHFMPLLSGYAKAKSLSIFSSVLSASLRSGILIDEAWQLAAQSANSSRYAKLGEEVHGTIMKGQEVGPVLNQVKWLPGDFVSGYRTAERSGNLDEALQRLSARYGESAMTRLKVAIGGYTAFILLIAMGFAAWKIISFYAGYFQRIEDLAS